MPDERLVVAQAAAGDRRAFEQIYRAYASTLFSYVLVPMLGDRDDAHDCLRETFVSAHRHLATFVWQDSGIYPWLKTLAKNKARDLLRASGRRRRRLSQKRPAAAASICRDPVVGPHSTLYRAAAWGQVGGLRVRS